MFSEMKRDFERLSLNPHGESDGKETLPLSSSSCLLEKAVIVVLFKGPPPDFLFLYGRTHCRT